jgi:hypothetical protein
MQTPSDSILAYLHAKDGNRPHLMNRAFSENASLRMIVKTGAITFPPESIGRHAITDVLVRRFAQTYENVYTFCLAEPPVSKDTEMSCKWLVIMSEKDTRAVRVGCGRYDWKFESASGLAVHLSITIEAMLSLQSHVLDDVMDWVSNLPYPWCDSALAVDSAPRLKEFSPILQYIEAKA